MHAPTPATDDALTPLARAIAFYLPQFHPIPENDRWWGQGFTEWTNVVLGRPRFEGHYQPHLPADLGFYDLRVEETRIQQAELARQHGIEGFCYYHYWFGGTRLLGRPLDDLRSSGKPDFPFALCWANESWARTWSGRDHDVLMQQSYSVEDHRAHIEWLAPVLSDVRYIRVDGRPLLLIYRPDAIADLARMVDTWKTHCRHVLGAEPWLVGVRTGFSVGSTSVWAAAGFDGVVDFQPSRHHFPPARSNAGRAVAIARKLLPERWYDALRNNAWLGERELNNIVDYRAYVEGWINDVPAPWLPHYPCVFPSWDNSVRRTAATIIENHDPELYARWLAAAVERVADRPLDQRLVFLNAWNEWAEGCHLEPDKRHGLSFLEATASALMRRSISFSEKG
ncbi:glycosyltransferase WbsX family protein [Lysobacter niastensis]|nr:glycoside hydrolase family 99-like domain-containing protein [Lysobacter niastensis]